LGLLASAAVAVRVVATRHAKDICKNLSIIEVLPGRFLSGRTYLGRSWTACIPRSTE
jgi:hypothetical protein